jgi:serpin B
LSVLAAMALGGSASAEGGGGVIAGLESKDAAQVVEGNTRFALDLYGQLKAGSGNIFLSPYSISTALAMTYGGARGETARQMEKTLHFTLPPERLHPAFHGLTARINGEDGAGAGTSARPYQLDTANALWGDQGDTFLPAFLELTRANYGAGLKQVDFRHAADAARRQINAWVEERTRAKIRDLVGPGDVTRDTSLVLVNAIYFKGNWSSPFKEVMTQKDADFHAPGGRTVKAALMRQTASFPLHDGGTFQLLEMAYQGNNLVMDVLLPKDNDGLPALQGRLTEADLSRWLSQAKPARVAVEFPRFTVTETFRLAEVLRAMGMPLAFGSSADFSGMNGGHDLSISEVIHKAYADVNEKGTEAAAATAVTMFRAGKMVNEPPPIPFRADHPFLFLIRDRESGSILFLGRVVEPKG